MTHPNALKTHCPKGHEFTADNTIMKRNGRGGTKRICRKCECARNSHYRKTHQPQINERKRHRLSVAREARGLPAKRGPPRQRSLPCLLAEPQPVAGVATIRGASSTGGAGDIDVPRLGG